MKKHLMYASVMMLVSMLFCSAFLQAQMKRMSPEDQAKTLKEKLQLSDDQTKKITSILEDAREEMTTVMSENKGDRDAIRPAMQDIMKKTDGKIKALLTDDQAQKYDALQKERRARMMKQRKAEADSTK